MKKKIIFFCILLICVCGQSFSQVASITFDPTNWYTAIDSLYATYDQIQTNIKQLETQYKQLQQAADAVKGWNLDDISWDGNFDIREELRGFTSSIDRQLGNINNMKRLANSNFLSVNGQKFSIADLVGAGEANKTILNFGKESFNYAKKNAERIEKAFTGRLTEKEKMAVMRKYGLSPANYALIKNSKDQITKQVARIVAANSEVGTEEWLKSQEQLYPALIKAMEENGETSPKQITQTILMYSDQINKNLNFLRTNILEVGEMIAWQYEKEAKEKQAIADRNKLVQEANKSQIRVSSMFIGGNSLRSNLGN